MSGSTLVITTPASDLALLTMAELRAAAGLGTEDSTRDTELAALGLEAAERIAEWCNVTTAGGRTPTLLTETLTETFRLTGRTSTNLILARRFVASVTVTENDVALTEGDGFVVHDEAGMLERVSDDIAICWPNGTVIVAYDAGFETVPSSVKGVATDFVRMRLSQRGRDPLVRSESAEGIDSVSYRDAGESDFEMAARSRLSRFVNVVVG